MCFIQLEDRETIIDVTVFPNVYSKFKFDIAEGNIIFTKGRKDGNNKWLADSVESIGKI